MRVFIEVSAHTYIYIYIYIYTMFLKKERSIKNKNECVVFNHKTRLCPIHSLAKRRNRVL
jgi:hypothetical protein